MKLTAHRHEASRGLSATTELFVTIDHDKSVSKHTKISEGGKGRSVQLVLLTFDYYADLP